MTTDASSFLPRILSVFYAVFHDVGGTDIVYQVPEGMIATSQTTATLNGASVSPGFRSLSTDAPQNQGKSRSGSSGEAGPSRGSSSSRNSQLAHSRETYSSYNKRSSSSQRFLFKFKDISRYVIPHSALCGRLVTCATRRHRIIGFPVALTLITLICTALHSLRARTRARDRTASASGQMTMMALTCFGAPLPQPPH